jgi:hypothetical protein
LLPVVGSGAGDLELRKPAMEMACQERDAVLVKKKKEKGA